MSSLEPVGLNVDVPSSWSPTSEVFAIDGDEDLDVELDSPSDPDDACRQGIPIVFRLDEPAEHPVEIDWVLHFEIIGEDGDLIGAVVKIFDDSPA